MALAMFTKAPEWMISEDEAKKLAKALADVLQHYKLLNVSPKTQAFIQLCLVAGAIYVPKIMLINKRKKDERAAKANATVFDMNGNAVNQ